MTRDSEEIWLDVKFNLDKYKLKKNPTKEDKNKYLEMELKLFNELLLCDDIGASDKLSLKLGIKTLNSILKKENEHNKPN